MFNGTVGVITALSTDERSLTGRSDEDDVIDHNVAVFIDNYCPVRGDQLP